MATWTYIKNLRLLLQTGQQSCYLYANGQNSVQVFALFDALDEKEQYMPGPVSVIWGDKDKTGAQLIDYITNDVISYNGQTGWVYENTTQQFNYLPLGPGSAEKNLLPGDVRRDDDLVNTDGHAPPIATSGSTSVSTYLLANTDVGATRQFGIRIVTAAGNVYYSSLYLPADGNKDGSVNQALTITPLPALSYDQTNTSIDWEVVSNDDSYYQANYYYEIDQGKLPGFRLTYVQNVGGHVLGPQWFVQGNTNDDASHRKPRWSFIWDLGAPPENTYFELVGFNLRNINSRGPNKLTLTVLLAKYKSGDYAYRWYSGSIRIFDQYGNSGDFTVVTCYGYAELEVWPGFPDTNQNGY